jgi:hypothetical protein
MDDFFACALTAGRLPLPGGLLHGTALWRVEHCVGPLGLGTLVVKPVRHVTAVAALTEAEAIALGPLIRTASAVATRLAAGEGEADDEGADQVYNCLWSHAGGRPVHVHYVVQPVTRTQMAQYGTQGPALQAAMFASGPPLDADADAVEAVADRARALFADPPP